jgi:hypothetical protein
MNEQYILIILIVIINRNKLTSAQDRSRKEFGENETICTGAE